EERRDVDQDCVEELDEFLGMDFKKIDVIAEVRDFHLLHALVDAAHEAGALVAGEIESARAPQVVEQVFKIAIAFGSHGNFSHRFRSPHARSKAVRCARSTWVLCIVLRNDHSSYCV